MKGYDLARVIANGSDKWTNEQQQLWDGLATHGPTGLPYIFNNNYQMRELFDTLMFAPKGDVSREDRLLMRSMLDDKLGEYGVSLTRDFDWDKWRRLLGYNI